MNMKYEMYYYIYILFKTAKKMKNCNNKKY